MSLTFSAWCLVTYSGAWILLVRPPTIITVDWLIGTAVCQSRAPSSNCFCLTQLNSSKSIKSIESNRIGSKSNRIESNQIESNRIESNQIKSNQIKSISDWTDWSEFFVGPQFRTEVWRNKKFCQINFE